jgi:hypothetical protein
MSQVHVITDRSGRALGCVGIVFGTMFGGFGLVFVAAVVGASIGHPNPLLIFPIGFGGLFALGGGAGVYFGVRSVWQRHLWGCRP